MDGDAWGGVMLVLRQDWEVIESVIGVPGRVLSVRVRCGLSGECLNFVVVYGKTGGGDGGAWMDGLADVMDQTYSTFVLGGFNFVEEDRDREGDAHMLGYDRTLARKFSNIMGGWMGWLTLWTLHTLLLCLVILTLLKRIGIERGMRIC